MPSNPEHPGTGYLCDQPSQYHTIVKIILPDKSSRTITIDPMTAGELLEELGINPVEVLVSRNGTLVVEDAIVEDEDEVRIFRITHGG